MAKNSKKAKIGSIVQILEVHPDSAWTQEEMGGVVLELTNFPYDVTGDDPIPYIGLTGNILTKSCPTSVNVSSYKVLFK